MTIFFSLFFGGVSLWLGAEFLVRGGASLAFRMGLPVLVIGLTILGYGTGTPELFVSLQASLSGEGDIALGNVIGSNIANTGLILGFAALCRPLPIKEKLLKSDLPFMVFVTFALWILLLVTNVIGRTVGALFILALVTYTWWTIRKGNRDYDLVKEEKEITAHLYQSVWTELLLILFGFFVLFIGGSLFLNGAIALAKLFQVSNAVIAVTVVAIGTSLPEFAVSVVAVLKRQGDVTLGNIIGSNIFNLLAIVGFATLFRPIHTIGITWVDGTVMLLLALLMWLFAKSSKEINRLEGALFFCLYFAYIFFKIFF